MQKNELLKNGDSIIRILKVETNTVLYIDCIKKTMPKWCRLEDITGYTNYSEENLLVEIRDINDLSAEDIFTLYFNCRHTSVRK